MLYRLFGMWAIRRAIRILTADDAGPLRRRLTREAKRVLVAAAITAAVLLACVILLVAVLIALAT